MIFQTIEHMSKMLQNFEKAIEFGKKKSMFKLNFNQFFDKFPATT